MQTNSRIMPQGHATITTATKKPQPPLSPTHILNKLVGGVWENIKKKKIKAEWT